MALVAPGEPADLRPPPRPGAAARSVSPWKLLDAPTLRPSTPHDGQGTFRSRQSVGEALQELQSKFAAFCQQEKEARCVQDEEVQKLRSDLGEEKAKAVRVGEALQELQSKFAAFCQQEKEARCVQDEEVQKLRSDLGEEKAKAVRVAADVWALQSENALLRGQLQQGNVWALQCGNAVLRGQLQQVTAGLQSVHQELAGRCTTLEEVQRSGQQVVEQLSLKVLVPEFQTDPTLPALMYSNGQRRCQCTGKDISNLDYISAVAKEGFTSGRQQFTVLVETMYLHIGVAVGKPPRSGGPEVFQQGVFLDWNGLVHTPDGLKLSYTTAKPFKEGSRVTMRL
eukprot:EG_transcript_18793